MLADTTFDRNKVLVSVEIYMNKYFINSFYCKFMLYFVSFLSKI